MADEFEGILKSKRTQTSAQPVVQTGTGMPLSVEFKIGLSFILFVIAALGIEMVSCGFFKNMGHSEPDYYQNSGSSYSARSDHDAGVKHWEETLSRKDRELNGMKTETDEEIHHDAEMLQHEQDEGISPAGMLEREIDGRNDK